MGQLEGKVAIITGATSGIGRASARRFVEEGARVVLGARRADEGEALAKELAGLGGKALFRVTDVTRPADSDALVALALEVFGRLDVAFDNAGVEATGPISAFDDAVYDRVFDTNVRGVFHSIRAQVPALERSGGGAIILTSSTAGTKGFPGASVYTASKHAVEGIGKSLALELAALRIRVNVLAPGPTDTPMLDRFTGGNPGLMAARVPMGRNGTAVEMAEGAVFLASDAARFVTGAVLHVNGGLTA